MVRVFDWRFNALSFKSWKILLMFDLRQANYISHHKGVSMIKVKFLGEFTRNTSGDYSWHCQLYLICKKFQVEGLSLGGFSSFQEVVVSYSHSHSA